MNGDVEVIDRPAGKVRDYVELMKPELTGLSVLTALCGFYLGTAGQFHYLLFVHLALGTLLVGGGAGALNQYIERSFDALMKRTERRPLPAGRLAPPEVLIFGIAISAAGVIELALFTNVLTGFLAAVTWTTYLFLYTPLKRVTPFSTIIGGIPGALPPVMGWTAIRNEVSIEPLILFAILFCWQMPHFFSLAWMYRKDYARAGFKILTVTDDHGVRTGRQILGYCIALVPVSVAPALFGMTGAWSIAGALVLGGAFLFYSALFSKLSRRDEPDAIAGITLCSRRLFFASLLYLPALMIIMSIDKI